MEFWKSYFNIWGWKIKEDDTCSMELHVKNGHAGVEWVPKQRKSGSINHQNKPWTIIQDLSHLVKTEFNSSYKMSSSSKYTRNHIKNKKIHVPSSETKTYSISKQERPSSTHQRPVSQLLKMTFKIIKKKIKKIHVYITKPHGWWHFIKQKKPNWIHQTPISQLLKMTTKSF